MQISSKTKAQKSTPSQLNDEQSLQVSGAGFSTIPTRLIGTVPRDGGIQPSPVKPPVMITMAIGEDGGDWTKYW